MASIISAGTTSGTAIAITGDTSGNLELKTQAGANTITVPNSTGTMMVSGNMPAFSAYQSSAQTLTAATYTKIQFQSEEFDTANCFDSTTNYRFTPNVAGYYQINAGFDASTTRAYFLINVYKNGTNYKVGSASNSTTAIGASMSALVYCNGTTDYIEIYGFIGATQALNATSIDTWFQGFLVRAA